jgi:L-lactate dehydrogenase complex protein LldG
MPSDADPLEIFERYARSAGAQVSIVGAAEDDSINVEAAMVIAGIVDGPVKVASAVREFYPELCQALEGAGHPVAVVEEIEQADLSSSELAATLAGGTGIVLAIAGVAETGSLVLADDALAPRLLSMLADVCVALVHASAILPSLDEAGALLAELESTGHRYVSMVTGPSRTADIERVLTIGVQGPKTLHVIMLKEIRNEK